ncbi:hypothetical protein ACFU9Y_46800 [Streptomyces sp. NPDC057621]|uniref:Uncharacterized protein n=1 Tax=Streptomyces liliiviolaceus TaxID=2823109 RepID=A0A941B941_9ACTN|nr:hypothetical protein [Streptomyces liliiviolaceus]MBQ0855265.1 hypothetical protein [Streptomyces liliiviolaceus]
MLTLLLHTTDAEQIAQVGACAFGLILAGLPVLQRSTNADCRRAAGPPGESTRIVGPRPRIEPSTTTVVLTVALGVAAFWLLDLVATWVGLGSLGYWSGKHPSDQSEIYRSVALRGFPILGFGVFAVAVAMAHRLHDRARPALFLTSVLYTVSLLVTNAVMVSHWDSEPLPENVYLPVLLGALAWLVSDVGRRYAERTQVLFDLVQAIKLQLRRDAQDPGTGAPVAARRG